MVDKHPEVARPRWHCHLASNLAEKSARFSSSSNILAALLQKLKTGGGTSWRLATHVGHLCYAPTSLGWLTEPSFYVFLPVFCKKKILWGHPPCKDAVKLLSTKSVLVLFPYLKRATVWQGSEFYFLVNYHDSFPFESCQWLFSRGWIFMPWHALAWIE